MVKPIKLTIEVHDEEIHFDERTVRLLDRMDPADCAELLIDAARLIAEILGEALTEQALEAWEGTKH